ncbi:hypothetical protein PSEUDO8O_50339 [Pseudomonas sp. 8O]|nr:hypothetical protein PSEUDO8O_50339 [Pseudomonas sp. 8O]
MKQTSRLGDSCKTGAGNETRTRDPDLGKVVLYQLSYSRLSCRRAPFYRIESRSQPFDSKILISFPRWC